MSMKKEEKKGKRRRGKVFSVAGTVMLFLSSPNFSIITNGVCTIASIMWDFDKNIQVFFLGTPFPYFRVQFWVVLSVCGSTFKPCI
jgi:hypothetical protein